MLSEANVSSSVQTRKGTSPIQVGLVLLGLEARGKLGEKSLVMAHDSTNSLNPVRVGGYPLPAEGGLVLEPGNFRTEITISENIMRIWVPRGGDAEIGASIWVAIFRKWRMVSSIWNRRGRTGHESLRGRPWLGIGEDLGEVSHIYMGNRLSEPSASCFSLGLSSGSRNLMFLYLPRNFLLSSHHRRGMDFHKTQIRKFARCNIVRAFAHSRTDIFSRKCVGSWVSPGQPYSTSNSGFLRGTPCCIRFRQTQNSKSFGHRKS